jgi:hypothetical protein
MLKPKLAPSFVSPQGEAIAALGAPESPDYVVLPPYFLRRGVNFASIDFFHKINKVKKRLRSQKARAHVS